MTATEYRTALAALELSQLGAARLFRVDARTSRRWALGEKPIPEAVAIALRLMIEKKMVAELLTKMSALDPIKPREPHMDWITGKPTGYLDGDTDWLCDNYETAVWLLENFGRLRDALKAR